MHLAGGSADGAPLEYVEVVGQGAHVVMDNNVNVTYYRRGALFPYGRSASFLGDDSTAPRRWARVLLGQLYNKNIFYLGYVPEMVHFTDCFLSDRPPERDNLQDSLAIVRLFEAYKKNPAGALVHFPADGD